MQVRKIALDPGYGSFKAAMVQDNGTLAAVAVPTIVGVGRTDLGHVSLGQMGQGRRRRRPAEVVFADGARRYLVGENVHLYGSPIERMDYFRLAEGPELRALLYTTLYRLLGAGQSQVALLVGFPIEVLADRPVAEAMLRALRGWLIGAHTFVVDGQEVGLEVVAVQAMSQPAGTYFAWGLDTAGRWTRSPADLKLPVAICDIGFNTVDLFAVQAGDVVKRFTGGDTVGMRRAAETLIEAAQSQYGRALSLHEADALLRERQPLLPVPGGTADVTELVQQALDAAAAGILSLVERRWGDGRQFSYLIFTGGGTAALRAELLKHYAGIILADPVLANAVGLAKYAQRSNVFRLPAH